VVVLSDSAPAWLIARPDKIGDLMCATPVFRAIRAQRPEVHIAALVSDYAAPVLQGSPFVDEVIAVPRGGGFGWQAIGELSARLRGRFEVAVSLYATPPLSAALWRAAIPERSAPASRWVQVFYNQTVTQRRSRSDRHEAVYNLELFAPVGIETPAAIRGDLWVSEAERVEGAALLHGAGSRPGAVGILPAMGGSAAAWPEERYVALACALLKRGLPAVVIADPAQIEAVKGRFGSETPVVAAPDLRRLGGVLANLRTLVGGSTGPLHMAAGAGTAVVGLYPSFPPSQTATRWGPLGEGHCVLSPAVGEGMETIGVEAVVAAVEAMP